MALSLRLTNALIKQLDATRPWVSVDGQGRPVAGPATTKEWFIHDTEVRGLSLRIQPSGAMAWCIRRRMGSAQSNALRRTIGPIQHWTLDAARAEARQWLTLIDQRLDPKAVRDEREAVAVAEKRAQEHTFGKVYDYYCDRKETSGAEASHTDRVLVSKWMAASPLWSTPFLHVTDRVVAATFEPLLKWAYEQVDTQPGWGPKGKPDRRPITAVERCWSHCKSAWSFAAARAFEQGAPSHPFDLAREPWKFDRPARNVVHFTTTDTHHRAWLSRLFTMREGTVVHQRVLADYALCLYVWGTRKTETAWLEWSMVDFDGGFIDVPARLTKANKPFAIPLTPFLSGLLKNRREENHEWFRKRAERTKDGQPLSLGQSRFLFPSRMALTVDSHGKQGEDMPLTSPYKTLRTIAKEIGLAAPLTPHALRRGAATETALLTDFNTALVSLLLNHTELVGNMGGATHLYIRERVKQLRPVMEKRERAMLEAVGITPPEVPVVEEPSASVDWGKLLDAMKTDPALKRKALEALLG